MPKRIIHSPYIFMLLVIALANWQLLVLKCGLQWDMMNFWMPWRYFMSECYNNGIVPLWNPYTQSGYPVHGDLQGPPYSPEAILVSFLFGQNIYVLNYCFVFYLYLGAVGMYKLAGLFNVQKSVAAVAGIIYALSGFNVAHGHYLYITVSVALVPFIFYYFFRILRDARYTDALKFSLILFWHITTGNPSFLIISGYFMLIIFTAYLLMAIRQKRLRHLAAVSKCFTAVILLSALMVLPVIYNTIEIIPLTTRKDGLDLVYAGDESFYFSNLMAFVAPLLAIPVGSIKGLWSCYVGIFTILFFIAGLFYRRNFFEWSLLFVGLAGLLVSFGLQTPVYPLLHKYLPLFNVFRMPNLSILFFLMWMIIVAGRFVSEPARLEAVFSKKWIWWFALLWALLLVFLVFVVKEDREKVNANAFEVFSGLREWIYSASPAKFVVFQALIFAATILLLLVSRVALGNKLRVLAVVCVADAFVNYQVGAVARIFSAEPAADMQSYFARFPEGFAVPAKMALQRVSPATSGWPGYWLNTSVFAKQPDYLNSNNFELSTYLTLQLENPKLTKNIIRNSYAFFADTLINEETYMDSLLATNRSAVTMREADFARVNRNTCPDSTNTFSCISFMPDRQMYQVKCAAPAVFVIAQNYCPRWSFTLNGRPYRPYSVCGGSFPAFMLPAGAWSVEAHYALPRFNGLLLFSLMLFTAVLTLLVFLSPLTLYVKSAFVLAVPALFTYCFIRFIGADATVSATRTEEVLNKVAAENAGACIVNNTSCIVKNAHLNTNLLINEDLGALYAQLAAHKGDDAMILNYDRFFPPEAEQLFSAFFGEHLSRKQLSDGASLISGTKTKALLTVLDTTVAVSGILNAANPYSAGVKLEGDAAGQFRPGDLFALRADIHANAFDLTGLTLEVHYKDTTRTVFYKYSQIAEIKRKDVQPSCIMYRLTEADTGIRMINCYVWNPTRSDARVSTLRLTVHRALQP